MTSDTNRPSAAEARQALQHVSDSRKALAPYVKSPEWLYPAQGLAMALFIVGLVFSKTYSWAPSILAVSAIAFCLIPFLQATPGRVVMDVYTHRGSRHLAVVYIAAFVGILMAAFFVHAQWGIDWAVYGLAALSVVLTVVLGPAMDARVARAMKGGR